MNKKLTTLAVIAAIGTGLAGSAQALDYSTGWFVNGSIGMPKVDVVTIKGDKNKNPAFNVNLGWRTSAADSSSSLGVEGGFVYLNKFNRGAKKGATNVDSYKTSGFTIGINDRIQPVDQWYVSARGGLFFAKVKQTLSGVKSKKVAFTNKPSSTSWYLGVGTGWDVMPAMSVGVNFDYYKVKGTFKKPVAKKFNAGVGVTSLSVEYRF